MQLSNTQAKPSFISLTPLIDVVFILLVFFMLASSFVDWQFIELGIGSAEEVRADSRSISTITLKPEGVYELNGVNMDVSEIIKTVQERSQKNFDHPILIQPLEGVPLQVLVSLLNEIHSFAADNVSLIKEEL